MRVVWKDSSRPTFKPLKYKGYVITGSDFGWETGIPGDDNLYQALDDTKAAINKYLGVETKSKDPRIHRIRIVGKKSETA